MLKLTDLSILSRNKMFLIFYIGQAISSFGALFTKFALPYQIYQMTKSSYMVGLLSLFQILFVLFTAFFGGYVADHYHRKNILILMEVLLMVCCFILGINSFLNSSNPIPIFILAAMTSGLYGFHRTSHAAILQQIVNEEDYITSAALRYFQSSTSSFLGPILAGLLVYYYGVSYVYFMNGIFYLISLFFLMSLKYVPHHKQTKKRKFIITFVRSVQDLLKQKIVLGTYVIDFITMSFAFSYALFPAIAEHYQGAKTLGMLFAAPSAGVFTISLLGGEINNIFSKPQAISLSSMLCLLAMIGFAVISHLYLLLFCLYCFGCFHALSGILRNQLWNYHIPQSHRGQFAAFEMIAYTMGPKLGDFRSGVLSIYLSISNSIILSSIMGIMLLIFYLNHNSLFLPKKK